MTLRSLKIRGPFHGPTGYDHHVREFTRAIAAAGIDIQLVDMPNWSDRRLEQSMQDPWFDTLNQSVDARTYLQFCMPHQVSRNREMAVANFTMFEASRVPERWVTMAKGLPATILPEAFSHSIWLASGVPTERLHVCPLGVDEHLFAGQAEPFRFISVDGEDLLDRRARLLNLAEVVPRKNHIGLLRAWLLETCHTDDGVLFLKIGIGRRETEAVMQPIFQTLELETGKRFADAAPVHLISTIYSDHEMPRLYASATHYVSMSFGEGWDLAMMEAAASGLSLIAPNHTAYRTYLSPQTATLIPVREIPPEVDGDTSVYFHQGTRWWEPDLIAARSAIREAIEGRAAAVASPRDFVLAHWSWKNAADRLIAILSEVEDRRA